MLVKICGITNREDAQYCAEAGADILGFVFAKSPRRVTPAKAKRIIAGLQGSVRIAGVFVNETPAQILKIAEACGLDIIQLHGDESSEMCETLRDKGHTIFKAIRVQDVGSLAEIGRFTGADVILLDNYRKGKRGGTGTQFDWSLAKKAKSFRKRLVLSGGLGVDNVADAVTYVRPYAVDASSRLESSPGKKDHALVAAFIRKAKKNT